MTEHAETFTVEALVEQGVLERPMDGNHGEIHPRGEDFVPEGIPFVMASDLKGGQVNLENCKYITELQARSLRKGHSLPGDVLLSHKATIGRTAIVQELSVPFVMLTPQVTYYRVANSGKLNNRYLKYYFDSEPFQKIFGAWAGAGSTRPYLGITGQLKLPIALVGIEQQNAIANVLGALDDKIELNRRMNETLEAMARAIFKDWFVDFGPTRAKMEGRAPYLAPDIWSLFPDRLDEDGKPEGWDWGSVSDVAEMSKDTINPQVEPECHFSHHSIPAYDAGQSPTSDKGADIKSNKTTVPEGSILLSKLNPEIQRVWLTDVGATDRAVCSTEFLVMLPKPPAGRAFLFGLFHSSGFRESLRGMVTGTSNSHQRVKPQGVVDLDIVVPIRESLARFESTAQPLIDRAVANRREIGTLAALRDLLLPKLMSGEIRIKDAEKIVGEAV